MSTTSGPAEGPPLATRAAAREKHAVAVASVLAAVALTALKGAVGWATGSLGIISEALHSLLDLAAAGLTLVAVRAAAKPADARHSYGHGKVENVSALVEGLLLLATCLWIVLEAVQRLRAPEVHVEVTAWSFAVMITSIVVDVTRARALSKTAKKYQSRALEADALHFSTDVWSSAVVIVGLIGVVLAEPLAAPWLVKADAVAALGVAAIVAGITVGLARRTLGDLLDEAPEGVRDRVAAAVQVPGVVEVGRVRVRCSGPESFADVTLRVAAATSLEQGHAIADQAEAAVHRVLPGADVVVHVEPVHADTVAPQQPEVLVVREMAARHGFAAHEIHARDVLGSRSLELHVEVPADLDVATAHTRTTAFEDAVHHALPALDRIVTHIEPAASASRALAAPTALAATTTAHLRAVVAAAGIPCEPHDLRLDDENGTLHLSFHCSLPPDLPITEAHAFTDRIERGLRDRLPHLGRVVIHVEPNQ